MTIKFKIGFKTLNTYSFDKNDIIQLKIRKDWNFNIQTRIYKNTETWRIKILIKENNALKGKEISRVKKKGIMTIDEIKNHIIENFNFIKDTIKLSALEVSQMSNEDLSYFKYVPPVLSFKNTVKLPIDPYYVGFWIGDGHSANPPRFTCGGETIKGGRSDQEYIIPYMSTFARNLGLECKLDKDKRGRTFAINNTTTGCKGLLRSDNSIFQDDWLEDAISACQKLEISKNKPTPMNNFQQNYDPYRNNLRDNNYYCSMCNYNTSTRKKKGSLSSSILKDKQYSIREHNLKIHNIKIDGVPSVNAWNKLSKLEKSKWKICEDRDDICKNSKYITTHQLLAKLYKIYSKQGENGLKEFKNKQIEKTNPIILHFRKLNLIKNKHIPDIYLKSSINDRKKLLAGIIDSDGTSGGKCKFNNCWHITQKNKKIIDGIKILAESLGMFCNERTREGRAKYKDGSYSKCREYHRITITPYNNWDIPVLLKRKEITIEPHTRKRKKGGDNLRIFNCR